jgi:hypothetical protein
MILLRCVARGHQFEGWFRDGHGFEVQQEGRREKPLSRMRRNQGRKGGDGPAAQQTGPPISPASARFGGGL